MSFSSSCRRIYFHKYLISEQLIRGGYLENLTNPNPKTKTTCLSRMHVLFSLIQANSICSEMSYHWFGSGRCSEPFDRWELVTKSVAEIPLGESLAAFPIFGYFERLKIQKETGNITWHRCKQREQPWSNSNILDTRSQLLSLG